MQIKNLKVLELASVLAGPSVGMFFSELGAEVIKIENKNAGGDITRSWKLAEESDDNSISAYYSSVNWNKEVIFIDYLDENDHHSLKKIIASSDIVITNFKAGDAEKFNLSYKALIQINPTIIYASINGFGEGNTRSAFDVVLQAETGFLSMTGSESSGPVKMPVALIDLLAAHQLKEGILVALAENKKPAKISVSLYDTAIASLANQASNYLMTGHVPKAIGTKHPNIAPYGDLFLTADNKQIVLAIGNNRQFKNLCALLNIEIDDNFKTNHLRVENRSRLLKTLQPKILQWKRNDLIEKLLKHHVPVGGVYELDEVFENPQAKSLVLVEKRDGILTKRVKSTVFKIETNSA